MVGCPVILHSALATTWKVQSTNWRQLVALELTFHSSSDLFSVTELTFFGFVRRPTVSLNSSNSNINSSYQLMSGSYSSQLAFEIAGYSYKSGIFYWCPQFIKQMHRMSDCYVLLHQVTIIVIITFISFWLLDR